MKRIRNWAIVAVVCATMSLSAHGQIPVIGSTGTFGTTFTGNFVVACNGCGEVPWTPGTFTSGSWLGFNQNGGANGEFDFINLYPSGSNGGFAWFSQNNSSLHQVMSLSQGGTLTVPQVAGNAATATNATHATTADALSAAPTPCTAGAAGGVDVHGNSINCVTLAAAQHSTVLVTAQTFSSTAITHFTLSFTIASTPAAGAVVVCTPQSDFGDETQYTCWVTGTTLFVKLTHGTVGLPFTTNAVNLNYAVMQ